MHADLAAHATPLNRIFEVPSVARFWGLDTARGLALLNEEVTRQAAIVAYANDHRLLGMLLPLMRRRGAGHAVVE